MCLPFYLVVYRQFDPWFGLNVGATWVTTLQMFLELCWSHFVDVFEGVLVRTYWFYQGCVCTPFTSALGAVMVDKIVGIYWYY